MEIERWREDNEDPDRPKKLFPRRGGLEKTGEKWTKRETNPGRAWFDVCVCLSVRVRQGKKTRGEQKSNCNTGKENMGDGSGEGRGGRKFGGRASVVWVSSDLAMGWLDFLGCKFGRGGLGKARWTFVSFGRNEKRYLSGSSCIAMG